MNGIDAAWIAEAAGLRLVAGDVSTSPVRAVIDSRHVGAGDLFFGLTGAQVDGGRFAAAAIESGCWGVVVGEEWVEPALTAVKQRVDAGRQRAVVMQAEDPLAAMQRLARAWRHRLGIQGATVAGITGSVGKTSTKDITRALLPGPVHASDQNLNTEIGLPLSLLAAEAGVKSVVLEMAMRGSGQIAELAAIAEPDVGAVINAGPVHTEILGSVEAVAAAKAELLEGLRDDAYAIVPADPGPLRPFIESQRDRLRMLTFGDGGDVSATAVELRRGSGESGMKVRIQLSGIAADLASQAGSVAEAEFTFPFDSSHNLANALAAVAVGIAVGGDLETMAELAGGISFSRFRGERLRLNTGVEIVNDCYNANPVSMRAALDHLNAVAGNGRRIAVLGLMAELGSQAEAYHAEIGAHARERAGIDILVGVGHESRWYEPDQLVADPIEAAELIAEIAGEGDTVLVKGSRSAGLEAVAETLTALVGEQASPLEAPKGQR